MSFDTREQEAYFEEIIKKIDSMRDDTELIDSSRDLINRNEEKSDSDSVVDQDIFNKVKEEHKAKSEIRSKNPLKRMLDGDEDETKEEAEIGTSPLYDDARPDIEEFESEDEIEEIYRDLKNTVGKMAVKGFAAFLLVCASLYLFIAGFKPALFGGNVDSIWFQIAWITVDGVIALLFSGIFIQGISKIIKAGLDTDGLLALLWLSIVAIRIIALFKPEWIGATMNFEPLLTLSLWYNIRSKKMIASNIQKNFKMISAKGEKLTATQPVACELNNRLILETDVGRGATYIHRTKLVSAYIENSFSDYEWDKGVYRINFILLLLVIAGTVAVSQLTGIRQAVIFPAASLSIITPFFSRYFFGKSIALNGKKIRKSGGILTSAESAKSLEDSDLLVLSDAELMGEESVLLQGIKAIGNLRIDELITYVAALFKEIQAPYRHLFLKMVDPKTVDLPRADDIYLHQGLGYS